MTTATLDPARTACRTVWQIDPDHTEVEFEVKHLMISKVRGRFGAVRGTIERDESDLAASSVEVEIDVYSIDTRVPQRDEHLRSADFFDAERFPTLTFRTTRIVEGRRGFQLAGELTIRGTTREVMLDVTEEGRIVDPDGDERIAFSASGRIDRRHFGLTWNQALETGGVLVGNEVRISLEVQMVKVS
jgi:polyisoprenoid-binding protein YceI